MTNSAAPDQLASDLDLHCLQRQGISEFSRTRVKFEPPCKKWGLVDRAVFAVLHIHYSNQQIHERIVNIQIRLHGCG